MTGLGGGEDTNGWREYRRLILSEIDQIKQTVNNINDKLNELRTEDLAKLKIDIAMLQVKSGIWGAVAGLGVAIGAVLIRVTFGH